MNRTLRRRLLRSEFKASQKVKRLEARAVRMTPKQARETLARWAAKTDHEQSDIDRLNAAMSGGSDGQAAG